jgi:ankyrin repeat protein
MPKPPEPPEPPIHRAARLGDVHALEQLIAAGADVNARADLEVDNGPHLRQLTPLMVAARSIDGATVETLRWLLEHGADLHARSEGTNTAAWYAAGKGGRWEFHPWRLCEDHAERLRFLLDSGLDPHETNFIGRSLLTEACEAGDPARLRLLLDRGCRASERSSYQIPLFRAAASGCALCVQMLLEAGADPDVVDASGETSLFHAGSPEVARLLLRAGLRPDHRDAFGSDVLSSLLKGNCCGGVCGPGRFDIVRVLIEAGADINTLDKWPHSRLAEAAFGHSDDAVEFLLALGADVKPPPGAPTALHCICWQGEYDAPEVNAACERIIRVLVKAGIPASARDPDGDTPLHEAAGGDWGNPTAIRVLLELGADPNARGETGETPLIYAAQNPDLRVVRLLLEAGADPALADHDGRTAIDRAREHRETWITLAAAPAEPILPGETAADVTARHQKALVEAEESLRMMTKAARKLPKSSRPPAP